LDVKHRVKYPECDLLGCEAQANCAMHYLIKYVSKDASPLENTLGPFVEAQKLCEEYASTAADAGTTNRSTKLLLTRFANRHF
jgi:hypothetical protein